MVKKLKQGQKYPEGFTQKQILLKLCEKDRTPTSEILDHLKEQFYIREQKNIKEHHLKTLEKQKLIRRESAGRGHPDYWSVIPDFRVLEKLVDRLDHDRDSQTVFMRSQYYHAMIPDLVRQFKSLVSGNDRWVLDTHQHTASREKPLSDGDEMLLTDALRSNWLALKWIVHFISVSDDERSGILHQLMESVRNPKISPTASHATGYTKGRCIGMDECSQWIDKDKELAYRKERLEAEMDNAPFGNHINWEELFNQLDHLNSNYSYLFD